MKRFAIALVAAVLVASLSAFAGRDGSDILLQQQTIKRLQDERAKAGTLTPELQRTLNDCRKVMSQPKQS
jgi:hypothetical protein